MRALVQRVHRGAGHASTVEMVGEIGAGLCVLVGVTHDDARDARGEARGEGREPARSSTTTPGAMNRSLLDTGGAALVVSQFTLYGDTRARPAPELGRGGPPRARRAADRRRSCAELAALGVPVATGRFRADMQVALVNDGPVTLSAVRGCRSTTTRV